MTPATAGGEFDQSDDGHAAAALAADASAVILAGAADGEAAGDEFGRRQLIGREHWHGFGPATRNHRPYGCHRQHDTNAL